jgi:hypothetical protein
MKIKFYRINNPFLAFALSLTTEKSTYFAIGCYFFSVLVDKLIADGIKMKASFLKGKFVSEFNFLFILHFDINVMLYKI